MNIFEENAFRINEEESTELPTIVAQVIGYNHAKIIFKMMEGNKIVDFEEWKGAMDVNYTFGGQLINNQFVSIFLISDQIQIIVFQEIRS